MVHPAFRCRFDVIVHRLPETSGGEWLIRVYGPGDEHILSAEGGVSLDVGLAEVQRAIGDWVRANEC